MALRSGYAKAIAPDRVGVETIECASETAPPASRHGRQEGVPAPFERTYTYGTHDIVDTSEALRRLAARQSGLLAPIAGGLNDNTKTARNEAKPTVEDAKSVQDEQPVSVTVSSEERKRPWPAYLDQRKRVTVGLSDMTLTVWAIDMIVTPYSVALLLPCSSEAITFVPRCGSELTLKTGNAAPIPVFFPGTQFEASQLNMLGLLFVRKEESAVRG